MHVSSVCFWSVVLTANGLWLVTCGWVHEGCRRPEAPTGLISCRTCMSQYLSQTKGSTVPRRLYTFGHVYAVAQKACCHLPTGRQQPRQLLFSSRMGSTLDRASVVGFLFEWPVVLPGSGFFTLYVRTTCCTCLVFSRVLFLSEVPGVRASTTMSRQVSPACYCCDVGVQP